jgi:hypothetical protein
LGGKESTHVSSTTTQKEEEFRKRIKDGGGGKYTKRIDKRVAILYTQILGNH